MRTISSLSIPLITKGKNDKIIDSPISMISFVIERIRAISDSRFATTSHVVCPRPLFLYCMLTTECYVSSNMYLTGKQALSEKEKFKVCRGADDSTPE